MPIRHILNSFTLKTHYYRITVYTVFRW